MGRHLKKPDFDHDAVMNEMLDTVVRAYKKIDDNQNDILAFGSLKDLAEELELKPTKVKKLLITAGVRAKKEIYKSDRSKQVLELYQEGKNIAEIMAATGLSRSSVSGYLPYSKGIYKASELSTDAERVRLFRDRQNRCSNFTVEITGMNEEERNDYLWETMEFIQGCTFYISAEEKKNGDRYRYQIDGGNVVMDKKNITISKKDVMKAFDNVLNIYAANEEAVADDLGIRNSKYLYPVFQRLGLCSSEQSASVST